jgi:hypothetical protein
VAGCFECGDEASCSVATELELEGMCKTGAMTVT